MPVKLPDKKTWARFADERGYPPGVCDCCGKTTRDLRQHGRTFVCPECKAQKNGTQKGTDR